MGSHWESSAIMDELMCASISKTRPIFTYNKFIMK